MMIERSCIFAAMATMISISAGTRAAKVNENTVAYAAYGSDSLLRGHRHVDEVDCLSIGKYDVLFFLFFN
jgi:hypothetical protein